MRRHQSRDTELRFRQSRFTRSFKDSLARVRPFVMQHLYSFVGDRCHRPKTTNAYHTSRRRASAYCDRHPLGVCNLFHGRLRTARTGTRGRRDPEVGRNWLCLRPLASPRPAPRGLNDLISWTGRDWAIGSSPSFLRHQTLEARKILAHPPSSSDQRQFERRTSELQERCEIKAIATPY